MSWSIGLIGTPEKVIAALNAHSETLSGPSKTEFDAALPNIVGIVGQNFDKDGVQVVVKLTANGHGWAVNDELKNCTCQVNVERFYGTVLV